VRFFHSRLPRGFTLIEILVVCAIVAVMLGLVMVRLDQSDSNRLERAAEDLTRQLEAARDESVIRGQSVAFSSDGHGYQFWLADPERNEWIALTASDTIGSRQFSNGIELSALRINGLTRPLGERIVFSLAGITEPFTLTLAKGALQVHISADALARIEVAHAQ